MQCFYSLQPGRRFQTEIRGFGRDAHRVSIPFNRDGVSKLDFFQTLGHWGIEFLFPSTGTAFPNEIYEELGMDGMQMAFLFPSTGKAFPNYGKPEGVKPLTAEEFLFPSNGKAFPNPYAFEPLCA